MSGSGGKDLLASLAKHLERRGPAAVSCADHLDPAQCPTQINSTGASRKSLVRLVLAPHHG